MYQAISQTLAMTFDNIRFFERQLKRAKKVITRELKAIPQTLDTVDGIGPILTAGIISEIGDIDRSTIKLASHHMPVLPGLGINLALLKLKKLH